MVMALISLLPWLQNCLSFLFSVFTTIFLLFSLLLLLLRSRPWCNCHVCKAYLSSSWTGEFTNLCDWYTHLLRQSPTRTINIHVLGNTVTANPDNVEYMLATRFANFPKGKPFSSLLGDLLGRGIFNVDGESWQFQRKMASLELGSVSVRSYAFHIVSAEVRRRLIPLFTSVSDGGGAAAAAAAAGVIDLQDVFRRFAFDNICKISFGLDPGCLEASLPISEFAAAFDTASRMSALRGTAVAPAVWKLKRLLNLGSERELKRAIRLVDELADELIRQRRKLGYASSHDLLSRFMCSVNDDRYLRDIVISFLLAGRDTVASGLTCFFLLLSKHPEVTAAIRDEIADVIGGSGDDELASFEQLKKMHYVHAAMYESLRLYPPVQIDSKFCVEDDMLPDGTFVRKGTRVTYHPYAMGRMERIWGPDCEEFKPERWLRDGKFVPASPFKYPVFQAGLRVCLGKEMALMEMKTVIVSVVPRFDVQVLDAGRSPKFAPGLAASIDGGLPAQVRRRSSGEQTPAHGAC
ncbi:cytochrome P450 94C1-like [Phoenix dactylifera]|uniref:Cytochrome P450 94C1-like n=1 Tax=Phoenix dactylifera TaxID=42345 RepID=A0A8B7C3I1_PHODC|nr:cytochrome P450 94C1-like [Phoenix dactylifera]